MIPARLLRCNLFPNTNLIRRINMRRVLSLFAVVVCLALLYSPQAAAACRALNSPTSEYTNLLGTERCSLGNTFFVDTNICRDADGNVEARFNNMLSVRQVPGSG